MKRKLDPYTLRYASACARKCATNARRLQMTVAQDAGYWPVGAALTSLANALIAKGWRPTSP